MKGRYNYYDRSSYGDLFLCEKGCQIQLTYTYNDNIITNNKVKISKCRLTMSATRDLLVKQYKTLCNERDKLSEELGLLPVGSIQRKRIKKGIYYYQQYREGAAVKTVFIPADRVDDMMKSIERRRAVDIRLKEVNLEISQIVRALGAYIHEIADFKDYKPVKNVDYKEYTMYMSYLAHELKRMGKNDFLATYSCVKEKGIKARYLKALISYLSQSSSKKTYSSANIVLDPLTYQMYFVYGKKDIIDVSLKKAVPEFLAQGLLITNIQEAVGGTLS